MMAESTQFQNLLGAIVANTNNILLIFLFAARIQQTEN